MPKGAPKPTAVPMVSLLFLNLQYLSLLRAHTHESPVSHSEPLSKRVEGNVATRALGVVVRRAHLARGGVEAAAGDGGREACDGTGKHLYFMSVLSLKTSDIGAYFDVRFVGALRVDWQCSARSNAYICDVDVSGSCWLRSSPRLPRMPKAHIPNPFNYCTTVFWCLVFDQGH
jgi:hypothetical protein